MSHPFAPYPGRFKCATKVEPLEPRNATILIERPDNYVDMRQQVFPRAKEMGGVNDSISNLGNALMAHAWHQTGFQQKDPVGGLNFHPLNSGLSV